ncbi:MAG: cyclic nucleotide-binding domain-containing protein [Verrucomicrobiota bacterium]|mgnify:CR=1 FL=1
MASDNDRIGYKIWAVDNVVYGPVELPILVGWVKEERVTGDTWIYSEQNDTWKKAGQVEELQMFFHRKSASGSFPSPNGSQAGLGAHHVKPGSLRRVKIFAGMSDEQLGRFVQFMEVQQARQWSQIVRQGEPGDAMYLVLEGEVRVRLMIDDKETILTTLLAGEFFGEIALFDHGPRSADVIANFDTTLLKISAAAFYKLASDAPDLASPFLLAIGKTLTSRIRADNKRFRDSVTFARAAGH